MVHCLLELRKLIQGLSTIINMPGQSSTTFSSTSKTSTKPVADVTRDSSSTYSYDPKKDLEKQQKENDEKVKTLIQSKFL